MRRTGISIAVAGLLIAVAAFAWSARREMVARLVAVAARERNVAPPRPIEWQSGPARGSREQDAAEGDRRPNIIVILADDLGMNDLSTFGGGVADGRVPTPNIDRLAREGLRFDQAYAGGATCAPSRAMLLTGRYPTRSGFEFTPAPPFTGRLVTFFAGAGRSGRPPHLWNREAAAQLPSLEEQGLPGSEVTLAEILRAEGYHTVHIGKWHLGEVGESSPNAQGFDESLLMRGGLHLPLGDPRGVDAELDFDPVDAFLRAAMQYTASFDGGPLFEPSGYLTDWWTDEAVRVIQANRARPFFLYLAHWAVHAPLQATQGDFEAVGEIEPHHLRVYAAMVRALDRSVGRVLDALREEGLERDTIVVFTSDNGGAGYIGLPDLNAPYRGWKATFFEGGIHVPLFVRWPTRIPPGSRDARPAHHVDLTPTLAAATNAPLPSGVAIDGIDLLDAAAARPNDALYWQSGHYRAVRQGSWKMQVSERPERTWLFDLASDPTERIDRSQDEPERVAALRALLEDHRRDARPPLHPASLESPISIDKTVAEPFVPGDEYVYWPN